MRENVVESRSDANKYGKHKSRIRLAKGVPAKEAS